MSDCLDCSNKKCLANSNAECLDRKNKHLICCLDDIQDEIEILIPTLDKIYDAVQYNTISKDTFSKTMYLSTVFNSQSECDIKIVHEIKRASYFFYNLDISDTWNTLSASFLKEAIKWLKFKTSGVVADYKDCDLYLVSLTSDIETIFGILGPTTHNISDFEEFDDLFF